MWERIDHWLQEIMPVAEEYKVQMACHPSDPGIGVGNTYRGVARPLGMVEGFKKLIALYDSPYNGLNFCQGCMSEALANPAGGESLMSFATSASARRFSTSTSAISKGAWGASSRFFPTKASQYDPGAEGVQGGRLRVHDHAGPRSRISGPEPGKVGFAYTFGYIHAALQAVEEF